MSDFFDEGGESELLESQASQTRECISPRVIESHLESIWRQPFGSGMFFTNSNFIRNTRSQESQTLQAPLLSGQVSELPSESQRTQKFKSTQTDKEVSEDCIHCDQGHAPNYRFCPNTGRDIKLSHLCDKLQETAIYPLLFNFCPYCRVALEKPFPTLEPFPKDRLTKQRQNFLENNRKP